MKIEGLILACVDSLFIELYVYPVLINTPGWREALRNVYFTDTAQ